MSDENNSTQKVFVDFLKVVKNDTEINKRILIILTLEFQQRKEQLDILLMHPQFRNAPEELQNIFTFLLDDIFAQEVLHYLQQ